MINSSKVSLPKILSFLPNFYLCKGMFSLNQESQINRYWKRWSESSREFYFRTKL